MISSQGALAASCRSSNSIAACLPPVLLLSDELAEALLLQLDATKVIIGKGGDRVAGGADVDPFRNILPSDNYLRLVAAIVADGYGKVDTVDHGWPILSVVDVGSATVADGATVPSIAVPGHENGRPGGLGA